MSFDPPPLFARIYARHGHRCPMSTLGGRLGLAALNLLGQTGGELRAVFANRTCALDGITEVTGCSEANGRLKVVPCGRHALTVSTIDDRRVEVELTTTALEMAGRYRSLCDRLEQGWENLDRDEQARRQAAMDALLDELLPQFWQAEDQLLVVTNG